MEIRAAVMAPIKIRAAPGPVFGRVGVVGPEPKRMTSGRGPINLERAEDPV